MEKYKISDIEILTGIKAHTLRIWEKRYGLMSPKRTETKIRYYTKDDLIKLLSIAILYDNGIKISRIAQYTENKLNKEVQKVYNGTASCGTNTTLLIQSMIGLRCETFKNILIDVINKDGLEHVYNNCLDAFFTRINKLWQSGKITAVQKHFVFHQVRERIIIETNHLPVVDKSYFDSVLFTSEGESNEIALLYYNYILRKKGYKTLYLGADLPIEDLHKTLLETHPKSLVVSIVEQKSETCYRKYIQRLVDEGNLPTYIGGDTVDRYGLPELDKIYPIQGLLND